MLLDAAILLAVLLSGAAFLSPKLAGSLYWRATVTPLASIIGSGFLVIGPILDASYGKYAPLAMICLCVAAYLFGAAIRFNIQCEADSSDRRGVLVSLDNIASWALSFAYIISVAYYLNLFGAFGVRLTEGGSPNGARLLTSIIFLLILIVGWVRGFSALERLEEISVSVKLAIIAGLLLGLIIYFTQKATSGDLVYNEPEIEGLGAISLALGLLITVQGFETSRYLGEKYSAPMRIRSMRLAQWISSGVYLAYIFLITYVFPRGDIAFSETAIIDMMIIVAPILPTLLVAAALSAQFSAAVADTAGAGGLFSELTKHALMPRHAYLIVVIFGLIITWSANVFEIINYASKAFALYYGIQSAIAALNAWFLQRRSLAVIFSILAFIGMSIIIFGIPVEH